MSPITIADIEGEKFFQDMPGRMLDRLATAARRVEFPVDRRIFREGGRSESFWLIKQGRVALDLYVLGRGAVIVETLAAGSVVGWSWLFPPHEWQLGAVVLDGPVHAIEFDGRLARTLGVTDPALGLELYQRFGAVLVERLQATRLRLLDLYHVQDLGR